MSEPAVRQRLREAREKATMEREASEAGKPVSDAPEAMGWPLRSERTAAEREAGEAQRPSMFHTAVEAAAGALPDAPTATVEQVALAVLRVALPLHETQHADAWKRAHERAVHFELELMKCADLNRSLVNENADMRVELERLRAWAGPTAKVEWGVQDATEPLDPWGAVACDSREDARRDAERYSREVLTNGQPTSYRVVTRLAGAWVERPDA